MRDTVGVYSTSCSVSQHDQNILYIHLYICIWYTYGWKNPSLLLTLSPLSLDCHGILPSLADVILFQKETSSSSSSVVVQPHRLRSSVAWRSLCSAKSCWKCRASPQLRRRRTICGGHLRAPSGWRTARDMGNHLGKNDVYIIFYIYDSWLCIDPLLRV